MRISELENGLKEIRERCGDCFVAAVDEHLDSEKVLTRLQLSEANIEGQKGDRHRIALLEILSKQSEIEEDDQEDSDENPGYFRDLKTFHEYMVQRLVKEIEESEIDVPKVLFSLNEAVKRAKNVPSERNQSENDVLNNRVREIVQKEVRDAFYRVEAKLETIAKRAVDEAMTEY